MVKQAPDQERRRVTKPIGKLWKALDLREGTELLQRLDPDWPARLQKIEEGPNEDLWQYESANAPGTKYRLAAMKTLTGWLGMCSCPGTRSSDLSPGAIVPCKHLLALLVLDEECDIPGARERQADDLAAMERETSPAPAEQRDAAPAAPAAPISDKESARQGQGKETPLGLIEPPKAVEQVAPVRAVKDVPQGSIHHSASSLPMVCACAASAKAGADILIGSSGEAGDIGSAVHEVFESIVRGAEDFSPQEIAIKHGVPDKWEEVRILSYTAWNHWNKGVHPGLPDAAPPIKSFFRAPQTEVELDHRMKTPRGQTIMLTGRADVFEIIEYETVKSPLDADWAQTPDGKRTKKRAMILDLKTGRRERNHADQLMGYAVMACGMDKQIQKVTLIADWVQLGFYDVLTVTREQVVEWAKRFLKYSAVWDGKTYVTGEHCTYCPRAVMCPAQAARMRSMVATFAGVDLPQVQTPSVYDEAGNLRDVGQLVTLFEVSKAIEKAAKAFKFELEQAIYQRGAQPIPDQPGMLLGFTETSGARSIDVGLAWPVLKQRMSDAELASILSVGIGDVLDLVAKKAEKGKGAASKRALEAELEAVSAIKKASPRRTLGVIKANEGGE